MQKKVEQSLNDKNEHFLLEKSGNQDELDKKIITVVKNLSDNTLNNPNRINKLKPEPKPKKNYITPSPMILNNKHHHILNNPFSLVDHFDLQDRIESEEEEKDEDNEEDELDDQLDNEILSALPHNKIKDNHLKMGIYNGKQSKDAEEILGKHKPKQSKSNEDEFSEFEPSHISMRHTINILPGKGNTGYSILNYLEMSSNENNPFRKNLMSKKQEEVSL